ncbi:MAG: GDSL-type esterase/lipase family protein [Blautia sp.]|nr:GDSL-type esterase/lipase family protein [Blautia sp.]
MKWFKKWRYLIFWVVAGIIYLSVVDEWQVYAKPLEQVKSWYEAMKQDFRQASTVRAEEETPRADVSGTEGIIASGTDGITVSDADAVTVSGADSMAASVGENGVVPDAEGVGVSAGDAPAVSEETVASEPDSGEMYHTVEDDYFADAVFIGDSRTVGMLEYGGLEETADFCASTGLTIYKLFDSKIVPVEGQKRKITVEEALSQNSYAKIYLMIGINEMGTGTVESFVAAYQEAVDHLLELQPDAILYIQGIIKVTTERSEQGDYINNEGIEARNEALSQLADNERIFYLDVNPEICDETGGMEASYTFDGVHLKAQYIDIWKTYLKEHAIVRETEMEEE